MPCNQSSWYHEKATKILITHFHKTLYRKSLHFYFLLNLLVYLMHCTPVLTLSPSCQLYIFSHCLIVIVSIIHNWTHKLSTGYLIQNTAVLPCWIPEHANVQQVVRSVVLLTYTVEYKKRKRLSLADGTGWAV